MKSTLAETGIQDALDACTRAESALGAKRAAVAEERSSLDRKDAVIDEEALRLEGERRALTRLLESISQGESSDQKDGAARTTDDVSSTAEESAAAEPESDSTIRRRKPAGSWQAIFGFVGHGQRTIDEIMNFCSERGIPMKRESFRSQMSQHRKSGLVGKGRPGTYALTDAGKDQFGVPPLESESAVNGSTHEGHRVTH